MGCRPSEVVLGDIADIQTGPFGSQLHNEDYVVGGTPIVTVEHLGNRRFTRQNLPTVGDDDVARLAKYRMVPGDIIFSRVGSVDRCSLAMEENNGWLFSGRCLRIRPNNQVDSAYLYSYLSSPSVGAFIRGIAVGATMPSINTAIMGEVPVSLPSFDVQRAIGRIMSSIESKIEVNQQLNDYLAQLCEVVAGKYCEAGTVRLGDICYQVTDKANCEDAELETYVSTESLLQNKQGRQQAASLPATGKVTRYVAGDTLISNIRPYFKKVWYAPFGGTCSGDVLVFRAKKPEYAPYLHACLRQDRFFDHVMQGAKGTKMPRGDKKQMMEFCVSAACEPGDLSLMDEALNKIAVNDIESASLAELRDTLLPRLMSGDIDVSKVALRS